MTIRVAISHKSHYRYDRPVKLSPHVVRLRPAVHARTPVLAYSLKVKPDNHFLNWQQDPFGNYLARLVFPDAVQELSIEVDLVAEMVVINPFDFFLEEHAEHYPFDYEPSLKKELASYLEIAEDGPHLQDWVAGVNRSQRRTIDFLVELNQRLASEIRYTIRMEPGVLPCEETLAKRLGSCRDSGWLLVQILRHLGLAARFVSGYLVQLVPDVKPLEGPAGPTEDFTDLHAWAEVYLPGAGWVGLDPTSGLFAGEGHIPLCCTPDIAGAAPLTGYSDPCETEFSYSNEVTRLHEAPRVTKPYSEEQWTAIDALGQAVDAELQQNDVRLTMGGEPTFVSIDDMDAPEWTVAALGTHKSELANTLFERLWQCFGPGGIVHYGQGKWYPGEQLPRWALGCFWRKDGKPMWHDRSLLALQPDVERCTTSQAEKFTQALARQLNVEPGRIVTAFEDTLYHLWQESNLPVNVDPLTAKLDDPLERQRLARKLSVGLGKPTGYVLPLAWDYSANRWRSTAWQFRRGQLFLLPGDSPVGLRLPLDALPRNPASESDLPLPACLFEKKPPLPEIFGEIASRYSVLHDNAETQPDVSAPPSADVKPPGGAEKQPTEVRTAICVEPRDGFLYVFLPPLGDLEHYLELIAALEATAKALTLPIRIEGYQPPRDVRLNQLFITPDPGVIEVNVHPAHTWAALVDTTHTLYEQARLARLTTEKFMLDGRHVGTGGGNHITLGGATPADSPCLRRPDLLRSLVTYWQHHPGLSYLFAGMFIGPTSQSPRVDEARHENLYELEIAFQQMPTGDVSQPWLVDRLLRNLLIDVTGNTHRAEICIDKLFSPDSSSGRLGLIELRAFEMPPHERMSLVQALLVRALIARFWQKPYAHRLIRWGSELHDRFMLPHYTWADMRQIVDELRALGYPFQLDWLAPFFEFRFPHYGTLTTGDIKLELRAALEPWHVLGEEVSTQGTARYVDSSVERLQIKLQGLTDTRFVVACNGRRIPLHSTGTHGEYVAGVRYRAWQPPSALHPTIGVHAPLVFDLIDTWNDRAIAGCTYHTVHPGGRSYEVFPVNAYEAEARRINRFWAYGHTPGPMRPPAEEFDSDYPYTLDLRRQPH